MKIEHVEGKKKGKVMLYALSTCVWCNKTKKYLGELGIEYSYVNVDQLPEEQREEVEKEIKLINSHFTDLRSKKVTELVYKDKNYNHN